MKKAAAFSIAIAGLLATSATPPPRGYTVLIRGGTIYDGSGGAPFVGDVGIDGDRIVYRVNGSADQLRAQLSLERLQEAPASPAPTPAVPVQPTAGGAVPAPAPAPTPQLRFRW